MNVIYKDIKKGIKILSNISIVAILLLSQLSACSSFTMQNRNATVVVEPEQPFCSTKKIDPNCKINGS